jgi:hypothetical protein
VLYRNLLAQQQHPCADIWPDVVDPETTIQ